MNTRCVRQDQVEIGIVGHKGWEPVALGVTVI